MKGQQSFEFLVILLLLMGYLAVVFGLFSEVRSSLQTAVDKKIAKRIDTWAHFISERPVGTLIKLDVAPFPGRYVSLNCNDFLKISTPRFELSSVKASCDAINITRQTCVIIEKTESGVGFEIC